MLCIAYITVNRHDLPALADAARELVGLHDFADIEDRHGGATLALRVACEDVEHGWSLACRAYSACCRRAGVAWHQPEGNIA